MDKTLIPLLCTSAAGAGKPLTSELYGDPESQQSKLAVVSDAGLSYAGEQVGSKAAGETDASKKRF